ncbi:TetR family transcriptional regulator [Thermosporothrix hazakensis]|jgi:AcrR family transcriptional regulator|uniref:TetR family transcriptional regulator n=2 Tax=Thermosporothrix TaxID=768650 RepID=A0A326U097_THEHA|nr:TetR/AcrR family transcriptional regulator [Thermosporothrix hazakensis]PZW23582.1 TetR family transcriptional regulator [Thermosporothrix hazakensis]BBH86750.1 TetR family transcriptional regulator [Thermosporothrix sp. COM3]GCE51052.1 TetR family transcriptional regulator [Thermosporothrix hazakensis]
MSDTKGSAATRQALLEAALRVVLRDGANTLTLDAVAHEAGLSKGGLLYHFPSKQALLLALEQSSFDDFDRLLHQYMQEEQKEKPGRWLRAYVKAASDPEQLDLTSAMMVSLLKEPDLLQELQQRFAAWQERAVQDGVDPALATLVRLAADGLWFADLLGLGKPEGELRQRVLALLEELTTKEQ